MPAGSEKNRRETLPLIPLGTVAAWRCAPLDISAAPLAGAWRMGHSPTLRNRKRRKSPAGCRLTATVPPPCTRKAPYLPDRPSVSAGRLPKKRHQKMDRKNDATIGPNGSKMASTEATLAVPTPTGRRFGAQMKLFSRSGPLKVRFSYRRGARIKHYCPSATRHP